MKKLQLFILCMLAFYASNKGMEKNNEPISNKDITDIVELLYATTSKPDKIPVSGYDYSHGQSCETVIIYTDNPKTFLCDILKAFLKEAKPDFIQKLKDNLEQQLKDSENTKSH